jgi:hypothetical protein
MFGYINYNNIYDVYLSNKFKILFVIFSKYYFILCYFDYNNSSYIKISISFILFLFFIKFIYYTKPSYHI